MTPIDFSRFEIPSLTREKSEPVDPALWEFDKNKFAGLIERVKDKKLVLALSAGRLKLACHLPILRLMEALNLKVDELWGVSAGAIVGGLWASGYTVEEINEEVESLNLSLMFDFFNINALKSGIEALRHEKPIKTAGFFPGMKVEEYFRELIVKSDKENPLLKLQDFYAISYNISRYQKVAFSISDSNRIIHHVADRDGTSTESLSDGDLADIIRASMSISGIYWPKEIAGDFFLDGGMSEHLPIKSPFVRWVNDVREGIEKRGLFIIASEAAYWDEDSPPPPNPLSIISESFEILGVELSMDHELYIRRFQAPNDLTVDLEVIRPELPYEPITRIPDFHNQIAESKKEVIGLLSDK